MLPRTIVNQLARLRRRERLLSLTWGLARWVAVVLICLTLACLTDWIIDRRQDTPRELRVGLLAFQAVLWSLAGIFLVLRPLFRRLSYGRLALFVEEKIPTLEHRLISALEFHQPGADTRGMSPELIGVTTHEAETQIARLRLARLADHRRLKWSMYLALPLIALAAVAVVCWPELITALLERQLLADRAIPRSVQLTAVHAEQVVPTGADIVLRFRAQGRVDNGMRGEVRIEPDGEPSAVYPLVYEASTGQDEAVFSTSVPASVVDFIGHAWLADGRTHQPTHVHVEPQPAVTEQRAWLLLPDYVGHRPNGLPYEQEQPHADIIGLPHAQARVAVRTQKPVVEATLELVGSTIRRLPMRLTSAEQATCTFNLRSEETLYRVLVRDRYGFTNAEPARRTIRLVAEETPRVALLPERFPGMSEEQPGEDSEIDGVPVPLGGPVRIAYWCTAPYGLGRARLRYRVNAGPWRPLPLRAVQPAADSGLFDLRRGAFLNSGWRDQVEFYAIPSPDPNRTWGGTEGGGRFDFQTRGIPGLKVGDHLEFYVEAFDRNPEPDREPGRSESRVKAVVTLPELERWVRETVQEESRIRGLERKQHGVFSDTDTTEPDDPLAASDMDNTDSERGPAPPVRRPPVKAKTPPKIVARNAPRMPGRPRFLRDWQLVGPFPNVDDHGFDMLFPTETASVNLRRSYPGLHGVVHWQPWHGAENKVDFAQAFATHDAAIGYAACWIHASRFQPALLRVGSDDGIKIWVNRRQVLSRHVHRAAAPGQDTARAMLKEGWNEVLVKLENISGDWLFYLELLEPLSLQPLDGVEVSIQPPARVAQATGQYLRSWQLLGPFAAKGNFGHHTAYPPEKERLNLHKAYVGIHGPIHWRLYHSYQDYIDLAHFFHHRAVGVGYGVCWVFSPQPQPVKWNIGSNDGIKLWVNDRLIFSHDIGRQARPGQDHSHADLQPGWNKILVKVDNHGNDWGFYLQIADLHTGQPLPQLRWRATPPAGKWE